MLLCLLSLPLPKPLHVPSYPLTLSVRFVGLPELFMCLLFFSTRHVLMYSVIKFIHVFATSFIQMVVALDLLKDSRTFFVTSPVVMPGKLQTFFSFRPSAHWSANTVPYFSFFPSHLSPAYWRPNIILPIFFCTSFIHFKCSILIFILFFPVKYHTFYTYFSHTSNEILNIILFNMIK